MSWATGKVSNLQLWKILHLQWLITWLNIHQVIQTVLQVTIWIVVNVDTTNSVLHHILHNPIRSKNLCGRSYLVSVILTLLSHSLRLTVSNIELVEPAYQLGTGILLVRDKLRMVDLIHKAIVRKNVLRQEKFRIVCYRPEALVDDRILMAVSHDEQGKLLAGLAVILQKSH